MFLICCYTKKGHRKISCVYIDKTVMEVQAQKRSRHSGVIRNSRPDTISNDFYEVGTSGIVVFVIKLAIHKGTEKQEANQRVS